MNLSRDMAMLLPCTIRKLRPVQATLSGWSDELQAGLSRRQPKSCKRQLAVDEQRCNGRARLLAPLWSAGAVLVALPLRRFRSVHDSDPRLSCPFAGHSF